MAELQGLSQDPQREIRVEPATLQAAADVCRTLRQATARAAEGVHTDTDAASRAMPGWELASALRDLHSQWEDDLARLCKGLNHTADGLDECARQYQASDHASMDNFYAAQHPW
ncbi:hypothetical protein [Catellatospora tritici]|uniref:hypothetical protein n=1 Tax=Catellatospora tritici TaxID=2851566 RepID=UPI001C2DA0AC|nr:hypothetical protein [Catellatospora tritici]MBV1854604.1 hypothetical protein [Catellatospora tritici]